MPLTSPLALPRPKGCMVRTPMLLSKLHPNDRKPCSPAYLAPARLTTPKSVLLLWRKLGFGSECYTDRVQGIRRSHLLQLGVNRSGTATRSSLIHAAFIPPLANAANGLVARSRPPGPTGSITVPRTSFPRPSRASSSSSHRSFPAPPCAHWIGFAVNCRPSRLRHGKQRQDSDHG